MTDDALIRLRALCDAATPGPWDESGLRSLLRYGRKHDGPWDECDGVIPDDTDAAFIAASRTALPALIELCEAYAMKDMLSEQSLCAPQDEYEAATAAVEAAKKKLEAVCQK